MSKDIKELLRAALKAEGADGLVDVDTDCGCGLDDLLITEHCPARSCEAARMATCCKCGHTGYVPLDNAETGNLTCVVCSCEER